MTWNAPKVIQTSDLTIRMRRGWIGSSQVTQRRIASKDPRAYRFFAYVYKAADGRCSKNGEIAARNLVEAFGKAKAMRKAYDMTGDFKVVFDHYGCTF